MAELLPVCISQVLASSNDLYHEDNNTEYIVEDYGGLI